MKIVELQNPSYIQVNYQGNLSYGGNQMWFSKETLKHAENIVYKWGCGLIAIGDLFLYLAKSDREFATAAASLARVARPTLEWEDYKRFLTHLLQSYVTLVPGSGMNGFAVAGAVRKYCRKYRLPMTIAWKGFMDDQTMLKVMQKMLREDLPIILAIGPNTPFVFGKKGIPFYTMSKDELIPSGHLSVHSHFVTVTGIIGRKHKQILLQIASWGNRYYIDYQEYRTYISEHGDTLTSSLLYLSKEDGTLF